MKSYNDSLKSYNGSSRVITIHEEL
jgi:hypothetical protein